MKISSKKLKSVETHQNVLLSNLNPNCELYEEKLKAFKMRLNHIYISIRISSKVIKMKKSFYIFYLAYGSVKNSKLDLKISNKIKIPVFTFMTLKIPDISI